MNLKMNQDRVQKKLQLLLKSHRCPEDDQDVDCDYCEAAAASRHSGNAHDAVLAMRKIHGETRKCLIDIDGECGFCAILDCPSDCIFHYHHDGCPECPGPRDPYFQVFHSYFDVPMPPACYSEDDYPFKDSL